MHREACGSLVPQQGWSPCPAEEAWSLSHWTTKEESGHIFCIFLSYDLYITLYKYARAHAHMRATHTRDVACLVKNWKSDLLLLQEELSFRSCLLHGDIEWHLALYSLPGRDLD